MPWVRIDENAMEHPKVAGLPDGAFRLWVTGLAYCQKFLTDGFISEAALRGLRGYTARRVEELGTSGLWHQINGDGPRGIQVHDFLDWNESREHVMAARRMSRERLKKHREKRVTNAHGNAHAPVGMCVGGSSLRERGAGENPDSEPFDSFDPPGNLNDLASRAGAFLERYKALHVRLRKGAHYVGKPHFDFQEALQLVQVFDDATLDKLAYVWMKTDHQFAESGTRTIAKFRSMATWCQEQLIDFESKYGRELDVAK